MARHHLDGLRSPEKQRFYILLFCASDFFWRGRRSKARWAMRGLRPVPANRIGSWLGLLSLPVGADRPCFSEVSTVAGAFLSGVSEGGIFRKGGLSFGELQAKAGSSASLGITR